MRTALFAVPFLIAVVPAHAGESANPAVQSLQVLVGKWKLAGSINHEGQEMTVAGSYECAAAAGGAGLKCHMTMTGFPDGFVYQVDDLWGWSPGDQLVHWFTVTNADEVHDHQGDFGPKGGVVTFTGPMEGKLYDEQIHIVVKDPRNLGMNWTVMHGAETLERGQVTMTRS